MKAVILAGGFGTRLKSVVEDVPKPMALFAGKPFLEHQIRFLKEYGIEDIIITVHHMSDKIKSYFGTGHRWGTNITYSDEEIPLGTAGAIKNAEKYIDNTFLVLNGDSYSNVELDKFVEFHRSKRSLSSMLLTKVSDTSSFGNVSVTEDKITNYGEKIEFPGSLINAGVYLFEPRIFDYIEPEKNVSFEKEIFPKLVQEGLLWGFEHAGYFMDIGRPETYAQFKQDVLDSMTVKEHTKVRDAMIKITKTSVDLILITDEQKKLLGVLNDKLIKRFILNGGNIDDPVSTAMIKDFKMAKTSDSEDKISEIIRTGYRHLPIVDDLGRLTDVEFRVEKVKIGTFPTVRGRAPLRIGFAGGGTDLPHYFEKYGGVIINATINKYCYATVVKRADSKIHINSELDKEIIIDSKDDIVYDGKYDIIKAVINIMKPDFGFEVYLHNDVPPGRGLGSSATLSVLLIKLLSYLDNKEYDDYKIAEIAYKTEREELGIKGGWQDQYAAVSGGFNFMEFSKDKSIIYPLKLKDDIVNELNSRLLLCYVGKQHSSAEQHDYQKDKFLNNEEEIANALCEHKIIAVKIKDALLTNELEEIGELLNESWKIKKGLSTIISNSKINGLYELALKNGAYGGRLLGAGGGGYILFFHIPSKRNQLTKALRDVGGEILDFNFEFEGAKIWTVKNKV